ncbi:MAG: anion transporter [Bacteroidota bacterium]|jgi:Na+/H+ antiporter NhaD/arsenite permease-like protein|nr:anion transporter [Bacteroidota bacterium]
MNDTGTVLVLIWIGVVMAGIAVGRVPGLRMNRASIALVGAVGLLLAGVLSPGDAVAAVDFHTLALLFGMMVLNVNLRLAGFFRLLAARVLRIARTPRQLLALVVLSSGLLSGLFLNDTIVLMFTPFVLELLTALERRPLPYLVALMTAANAGSVATVVGNPQNMLIGMASGMDIGQFTLILIVPALLALVIIWLVVQGIYRDDFRTERLIVPAPRRVRTYRPLLRKSLFASFVLVAALAAGLPVALAALGAASLLLVTRRLRPERVFWEIDWTLLVFFAGLFVVTAALHQGPAGEWWRAIAEAGTGSLTSLTLTSVLLSNIVSNVPAVLLLAPLMESGADPILFWCTLAMATTFAGNLTLLGSVANMIVAETAAGAGVRIGFGAFLRAGVPITLLTVSAGLAWMLFLAM